MFKHQEERGDQLVQLPGTRSRNKQSPLQLALEATATSSSASHPWEMALYSVPLAELPFHSVPCWTPLTPFSLFSAFQPLRPQNILASSCHFCSATALLVDEEEVCTWGREVLRSLLSAQAQLDRQTSHETQPKGNHQHVPVYICYLEPNQRKISSSQNPYQELSWIKMIMIQL